MDKDRKSSTIDTFAHINEKKTYPSLKRRSHDPIHPMGTLLQPNPPKTWRFTHDVTDQSAKDMVFTDNPSNK